ncbi:MAG: hypothetical protein K2N85_04070 [Lachnospiraceae bacterium]|nr:hypothetical protein [Lachnospiraceae bacterium]
MFFRVCVGGDKTPVCLTNHYHNHDRNKQHNVRAHRNLIFALYYYVKEHKRYGTGIAGSGI